MTKANIEVTRDWTTSLMMKSKIIKVTTYTDGVANKERTYTI